MIGGNAFAFGKNQLKHLRPMKKSSGQFQLYGLDDSCFSPQICALLILRKADVIYAGFYVTLEVFHPLEIYRPESVLVLPATIVNDNAWKMEVTNGDAQQSDGTRPPINLMFPIEHELKRQKSGSLKKAIREVLSLKSKSSPERHHSHAYDLLLPHSLARSLVFSADINDAILDMDWNYDHILTLSWKRLEKPTLYFGSAGIGEHFNRIGIRSRNYPHLFLR